ncbi:ChrR family anti-sigma-E factor [Alphaproteobacteria bacterium]|jgi:putative transcriptional regulator|nr:ChrR family anti-sigma-E factor [Alphaproteobacteria bacterium]
MIPHHPSDALLLDYASGAAAEPVSLLVATHLTLCPECREKVAAYEAIGGMLIEEADEADALPDSLRDRLLSSLDELDMSSEQVRQAGVGESAVASKIPQPLRAYCEEAIENDKWQWSGFGIKKIPLLKTQDEFDCYLLMIRGGKKVPQHDHAGNEWTLVLDGSFADETGHFGRGDIAERQQGEKHQPVAGPGADCICLVVADAPVALTGPVGRYLNSFISN